MLFILGLNAIVAHDIDNVDSSLKGSQSNVNNLREYILRQSSQLDGSIIDGII